MTDIAELHASFMKTVDDFRTDGNADNAAALEKIRGDYSKAFESDFKARAEREAKSRVPETYDIKLPEGSVLDADHVKEATARYKELGFSNDVAKAMIERENALLAGNVEKQKKQAEALSKEMQEKWLKEIAEDKELGTDIKSVSEKAKRVIERFAGDRTQFIEELGKTGLGNHPELLRLLYRIGTSMSEDQLVKGWGSGRPKTREEKYYQSSSAA